ncbi:hypothetical protein PTSG_01760 [Salpingoeca rosetta]|uniref:SMP-30/Gluconolactonase/LRE-like region domain-containing protein n=1 Tax=Salpingoeca rosetta (strain ATCC 50818 / BSB-021) TaxID=946362 RepID=F2TYW0_SALR5|nr:uncharacterized protein PTSG_01760 [Salpingoeca rosetta]EGD78784.1 hypothetical protein PTSG_01760 [Salpingoeca rosetta]|eukprot:XP_004997740.1 hypothetical protein PTSG_01760 [Salpingoeca rosetta]
MDCRVRVGNFKWFGGVLAPNGLIYGIPSHHSSVLIIDPTDNSADITTMSGLGALPYKWNGAALANNGMIYASPRDSDRVLIIDPSTNTADNTTIAGSSALRESSNKWFCNVVLGDNRVLAVPLQGTAALVIDPATNVVDTITIAAIPPGTLNWGGCVLGDDGAVYAVPSHSSSVLVIGTHC